MSRSAVDVEQDVREAVEHFLAITPLDLSDPLMRQMLAMSFLTGMEAAAELTNNAPLRAAVLAVEREIRTD